MSLAGPKAHSRSEKIAGWKSRNRDYSPNGAIAPGEGADAARGHAGYRKRNIAAILE